LILDSHTSTKRSKASGFILTDRPILTTGMSPLAIFESSERTDILSSFAASMRVINACIDTIIWSWELASKERTAPTNLICCSGL
jgi:hypothetical protein